jgi:putative urate catabolism protein
MPAAQAIANVRHMSMESIYEYGSRAGVWRILKLFEQHNIPLTIFAVAMAAERHPELIKAMHAAGHEICSHGYRWIDYQYMSKEEETEHLNKAIEILQGITGERPLGWYTGRTGPNTRDIVMAEGGFLYDSDSYDDDLPYWVNGPKDSTGAEKPHLIIPYTLDTNDMRFATPQGFNSGAQFYQYLKDAFDVLYEEGANGAAKMLSIGLHCRLIGRPARLASLKRFIEYAAGHQQVWFPRRMDIAKHWHEHHYPTSVQSQA